MSICPVGFAKLDLSHYPDIIEVCFVNPRIVKERLKYIGPEEFVQSFVSESKSVAVRLMNYSIYSTCKIIQTISMPCIS